jgi:hypothetical protein
LSDLVERREITGRMGGEGGEWGIIVDAALLLNLNWLLNTLLFCFDYKKRE